MTCYTGTHVPSKWEAVELLELLQETVFTGSATIATNIITITTTTVEPSSGKEQTLPPNEAVLISEALGEGVWINTSPLVTGLVDFSGSKEMPTGEFQRRGEGSRCDWGGRKGDGSRRRQLRPLGPLCSQTQSLTFISYGWFCAWQSRLA